MLMIWSKRVAALLALATMMPTVAASQLARRNDALALVRELDCTAPKHEDSASPLPGAPLPSDTSTKSQQPTVLNGVAADVMLPFAPGTRNDAGSRATLAHVTGVLTSPEPCEFAWELRADVTWAGGGAVGGAAEFRMPAVAFGSIGWGRGLASLQPIVEAVTTRRTAYDPRLALERDVAAGLALRLHLPDVIDIPGLGKGYIKQYPSISLFGRWAWDDSVRSRRGESIQPHLAIMTPLPILRFDTFGIAYGYERVWDFADTAALSRHWVGLTIGPGRNAPVRATVRWSLERLADATVLRQFTIALHTRSFAF